MSSKRVSPKVMAVITASLVVAATALPAFAEEAVNIYATDENKSVSVDSIYVEGEGGLGLAATAYAYNGNTAELEVAGDVEVQSSGGDEASPVYVNAVGFGEGSASSVDIGGSITVDAKTEPVMGLQVQGINGGEAYATVGGDVSISAKNGQALYIMPGAENSKSTVEIGGSVTIEAEGTATGLQVQPADSATADVVIGGDVTATADVFAIGINTDVQDATASVQVKGDVTGSTTGLGVYAFNPNGSSTVDVVIEGTLTGKEYPVYITGDQNTTDVKLTAWQIVPNADGKIVCCDPESDLADAAAELEAGILYIIKAEQPNAGGSFTLGGTSASHGFDTAKEGDTVTLKAAVQSGYTLKGAYNNGTALTLKDADGNYYIVVPKGGGVSLSVILEKIAQEAAAPAALTPVSVTTAADTTEVAEKQLIDELAVPVADSEAQIAFYDDSTFVITLVDGTELEGTFAFVDGKLTFNGVELDVTIDEEDGSYHCVYTTETGEEIQFVLDAEFVEKLKAAVAE